MLGPCSVESKDADTKLSVEQPRRKVGRITRLKKSISPRIHQLVHAPCHPRSQQAIPNMAWIYSEPTNGNSHTSREEGVRIGFGGENLGKYKKRGRREIRVLERKNCE